MGKRPLYLHIHAESELESLADSYDKFFIPSGTMFHTQLEKDILKSIRYHTRMAQNKVNELLKRYGMQNKKIDFVR